MTPEDLHQELGQAKIRPAYLLAGPEALLRDDASQAIAEAVFAEEGPRDFDFDRLDGASLRPAELLDALAALPVLAARRLVLVREPEARRAGAKALCEALATALPELLERSDVVLVVTAERIDRRSRWVKAFAEPGALVACDPPKGSRALLAFVRAEAKRQELRLGAGAAEALAEAVGPQLLALRQEIAKASLHAGPEAEVSRADVLATASAVAEEPVWDLTDAIGEGRVADALGLLDRLLDGGVPGPVLLGTLASHFRKLARLRAGGRAAGPPFAIRKLESQSRRYTPARLRLCLGAIHAADETLKGQGELPADLALERLVLGLSA